MNKNYYLAVCLNPVLQKTIVLPRFIENEVNRSREHYFHASGKGVNVTRILTQLGEKAVHLTHAGGFNQQLFLNLCRQDGLEISCVNSNSEIRFCYTLINRETKSITEIVEEALPVAPDTGREIFDQFQNLLEDASAIIISGTKAAGYPDWIYPRMTAAAKEKNKTIILDIRDDDLTASLKYHPDFIKPNWSEFVSTWFKDKKGDEDLLRLVKNKMAEIYESYNTVSIITNGKSPTLVFDGKNFYTVAPQLCEPVNTIGCGDSFAAGFIHCYMNTRDIRLSVDKGHECALKNAMQIKPGTLR